MGTLVGAEKSAAKKCGCTVEEWRAKRSSGLIWCYHCKQWKPSAEFNDDASRSTGKTSSCRPCVSQKATRSRYSLSRDDHEKLERSTCPICDREGQPMHLDHNHNTGAVRGFLCSRCNTGLGLFCDNPRLLRSAVNYLEKHNG